MKLKDIYKNSKSVISYEIFPPKTIDLLKSNLLPELEILKQHNPRFISLTCSAGGTIERFSTEMLECLKENTDFEFMSHLTCVCNNKRNIKKHLSKIQELGIENILALRGDKPVFLEKTCQDFEYASELVEVIKKKTDCSIGVAGYPEGHIEAPDLQTDIENLKRKVDAGADVIFTQLFFDNDVFYSYVDKVRAARINLPIVAGIMPVLGKQQIERMTSLARITVPKKFYTKMEELADKPFAMREFGVEFATQQCQDLLEKGVDGLHFYTLNRAYSTNKILTNIL